MARLLAKPGSTRQNQIFVASLAAIIIAALMYSAAYASYYYGKFTGYAMGNQYGGAGVEIRQGHFANHYYLMCPNDPAAYWTWGTQISTPVIYMHNQSGQTTAWTTFLLYDVGDFGCTQGNYWVDVYFGRYKPNDANCYCGGVWGYCYWGSKNSCTDAINFGYHYYTYWGPPH